MILLHVADSDRKFHRKIDLQCLTTNCYGLAALRVADNYFRNSSHRNENMAVLLAQLHARFDSLRILDVPHTPVQFFAFS